MSTNQFFEKKGPFPLKEIAKIIGCTGDILKNNNFEINSLESLDNASSNDMTFLNSIKYQNLSLKTKAAACITTSNLSKFLPEKCIKLNVKNVHLAVTQVSKMFYPKADLDYPDLNLVNSDKIKNIYPGVVFGNNVLIGKNVQIGNNTFIGSNSIIESNVQIGKNCIIGCNVVIKKTIIGDNVNILDGAVIGKKGFGFFPGKNANIRYPHIGMVIIKKKC